MTNEIKNQTSGESWMKTVTGVVKNNPGWFTAIGVIGAAAVVLTATERGRSFSRSAGSRIKGTTVEGATRLKEVTLEKAGGLKNATFDGANRLSNYAADLGKQVVSRFESLTSSTPTDGSATDNVAEQTEFDEKIHQLQEHFRRPAV